jgi:hypothetical protein
MEQRANIKFRFKTGKTATETFQLIRQAYGDNALSRTRVFELYARFRDGRENLDDDERSGRPTTVRTPDMIETVRELISTDRRMTLRMMEEEVLSRLVQRIGRVRRRFQERGSWFLLHDNARPHTAIAINQFLVKHFTCGFLKIYAVLEHKCHTLYYSTTQKPMLNILFGICIYRLSFC